MVPISVHPAAKGHPLTHMLGTQLAASMSAQQDAISPTEARQRETVSPSAEKPPAGWSRGERRAAAAASRSGDLLGQLVRPEGFLHGHETTFAQTAKPRALAARKPPGVQLDQLDRLLQRALALQVLDHLAIAQRLPRRPARWFLPGQQPSHFIDQAGPKHRLHPGVDPAAQLIGRPVEHKHPARFGRRSTGELLLPVADRAPGVLIDFQCPNDPADIVWMQSPSRLRVHLGQALVQGIRALPASEPLHAAAKFPVGRRSREDAPQESLQIQGGAAHEKHFAAGSPDCFHALLRSLKISGQAERLMRIYQVDQMVGHPAALLRSGFGRANVHAAVDGHRIHGNDFRAEALGQRQTDGGLAGGCRTGKKPAIPEGRLGHGAWCGSSFCSTPGQPQAPVRTEGSCLPLPLLYPAGGAEQRCPGSGRLTACAWSARL